MPNHLFQFTSGQTITRYTNARRGDFTYDGNIFERATLSLSKGDVDLAGGTFTIEADPGLSPLLSHVSGFPPGSLKAEVRSINPDNTATLVHSGELRDWGYERRSDTVKLTFDALSNALASNIPDHGHGPVCNWILGGARAYGGAVLPAGIRTGRCTVDLAGDVSPCVSTDYPAGIPFTVGPLVVATVFDITDDGQTYTSKVVGLGPTYLEPRKPLDPTDPIIDFGTKWFSGGTLMDSDTTERALIVSHTFTGTNSVIRLLSPLSATPTNVKLIAGCSHLAMACRFKFNNEADNGGFPFTPRLDPFREGFI